MKVPGNSDPEKPYKELGSIEGTAKTIDRDGRGRLLLWIHVRLTGDDVRCFVSGEAATEVGRRQIRDVWRGRRVAVYGVLHYKGLGKLNYIDAIKVRFQLIKPPAVSLEQIKDPNFTGGLSIGEYLDRLRDGTLG
jgi:hypothetical protein